MLLLLLLFLIKKAVEYEDKIRAMPGNEMISYKSINQHVSCFNIQ